MKHDIRNYQQKTRRFIMKYSDSPPGLFYTPFAKQTVNEFSIQGFPGAILPDLGNRDSFPVPDQVGKYCTKAEFLKLPKFMAQWVHWPDRVESILGGNYSKLIPVHFEGIFTLACNLTCPHCTRRVARRDWVEKNSWSNNSEINEQNTIAPSGMRHVIENLAANITDGQMGIVWGGGDPTANPYSYDGIRYAKSLGISSSFITNGVFLDVEQILNAEPTLVRISLNCGSEDTYRRFHGYPRGWDYFEKTIANLRDLVKGKLNRRPNVLVGISLIMDERNINDIVNAVDLIKTTVQDLGPGIDYVIVRPVFNYHHFKDGWTKIKQNTKDKAKDLIAPGGPIWSTLNSVNIPLVPIKDSFDSPPSDEFYKDVHCLSYGMCGEIRYNGDVQLCSDSYGNPDYTIGNLLNQSLEEIWSSERRVMVLDRINKKQCYKTTCPHNSRGHHYNRIFHQIEEFRATGQMAIVRKWVEDLRSVTYPLGHSFFL